MSSGYSRKFQVSLTKYFFLKAMTISNVHSATYVSCVILYASVCLIKANDVRILICLFCGFCFGYITDFAYSSLIWQLLSMPRILTLAVTYIKPALNMKPLAHMVCLLPRTFSLQCDKENPAA